MFLKLFLLTIIYVNKYNCEIFTSSGHLKTLVDSFSGVTEALGNFIDDEYSRLAQAVEIYNEYRSMSDMASKDAEKFIGNPVNAFLMIKKLTHDLQNFVDSISNFYKTKDLVNNIKDSYLLPTTEDYNGAGLALLRLEDTYNLKPRDIRLGKLSSKYPSKELTANECFELGRISYDQKDYYHTVNWMSETLYLIENYPENVTDIDKFTVLDYLSYAVSYQGNIKYALDLTKQMLAIDPNHTRSQGNLKYYEEKYREEINKQKGDHDENRNYSNPLEIINERPVSPYPEREIYESLCRGEIPTIPPKRLKKLKCRYINYNSLILIAPVKEEQLYDEPAIWLYHDVISERQVEVMKLLGAPKLKRAIVRSPITGQYITADYRISKSGWLKDDEHPQFNYLTRLVNAITNLTLDTAEEWQISNYGIGGQYEPHFDFARKTEPENAFHVSVGNRIATWLFYLEVPEKGGATVFPSIGVAVEPKRRAAAFWYNLLKSGDGDYNTRHAACPVLFGEKWVSNKWIHSVGQEFIRPCGLVREISEEMFL